MSYLVMAFENVSTSILFHQLKAKKHLLYRVKMLGLPKIKPASLNAKKSSILGIKFYFLHFRR
jgi:hypothetical protein